MFFSKGNITKQLKEKGLSKKSSDGWEADRYEGIKALRKKAKDARTYRAYKRFVESIDEEES